MKLLITGGAGFIGSNLVLQLMKETEHEVVNVDKLTYAANLDVLQGLQDEPRHSLFELDICDREGLERVFAETEPDVVLHLAAESHVDRSIEKPVDFLQSNVMGTYQLLQCARRYWGRLQGEKRDDFRLLHVSTDEVYGSLQPDEAAFTEESRYDPHSPYSASKAAADHLVRAWQVTYGLPTLVSNSSNNYGAFQHDEKLIPQVITRCLQGEPIPVYGSGEQVRDWLHVEDHCRALRMILENGEVGMTYNVGAHCELRNRDLVNRICELLDDLRPRSGGRSYVDLVSHVADRPGHDVRYAINAERLAQTLGWEPKVSFGDGLRQTVELCLRELPSA